MIKFAYTTDWHLKSMPSDKVHIDSFSEVVLFRIKQILSSDVDFIIHGGDLSDTYEIEDMNLFNKVIKLLYEFKKRMYIVPGSHDLIGYSPTSLWWTALKTLENAGLLMILPPGLNHIDGLRFQVIYPTKEHTLDLYRGLTNMIVLSHNLISPIPVPFKHVRVNEIANVVNQCLFLCADLHMPFIEMHETSAFLNPGPLIKSSLSDKSDSSGFFIIWFDKENFSCSYKRIEFPDVKIQSISANNAPIQDFMNKIKIEQPTLSLDELVSKVSNDMFHDPEITQEALRWIRSKE